MKAKRRIFVLVSKAAGEKFTFDLEQKVQQYVNDWASREGKSVTWWDMEGRHEHLIEYAYKYER